MHHSDIPSLETFLKLPCISLEKALGRLQEVRVTEVADDNKTYLLLSSVTTLTTFIFTKINEALSDPSLGS